jgi:hypothetical protein
LVVPPTAPLEELPTPELELPEVLGLVVELELGLEVLAPVLAPPRARASQSCFAMPLRLAQLLAALPEPLVLEPRLPELPVLGLVVLLLEPGVLMLPELGVDGVVLLGLEPLELEVCATETPAAPRNAAATAAQRSLLVIVLLLEE